MRLFVLLAASLTMLLVSCGPAAGPPAPSAPAKVEAPKPADESRHLPKTNLVESKVVDKELMGKAFMPGGTVGHYRKGKTEYDVFITKLPTPLDAAILLPDWNKALAGSKLVPSFGGYFGDDQGRPVFVFSKGAWIAGISGLPAKDADTLARSLATLLN
jgi:hypothetical protein